MSQLKKPCNEEIRLPQISTSPRQPRLSPILQDMNLQEGAVEEVEEAVEEAAGEEEIQTRINR
jgi:hypothetical protein